MKKLQVFAALAMLVIAASAFANGPPSHCPCTCPPAPFDSPIDVEFALVADETGTVYLVYWVPASSAPSIDVTTPAPRASPSREPGIDLAYALDSGVTLTVTSVGVRPSDPEGVVFATLPQPTSRSGPLMTATLLAASDPRHPEMRTADRTPSVLLPTCRSGTRGAARLIHRT